ncbi:MAG: hypothetical protein WDW36_009595 [Sanguina aurantia]
MSLVKQAPSHPQSSTAHLVKGCCVLYHDRAAGTFIDAEITHVDLSVDPPQYGIHISSREAGTTKYTEAARLVARQQPQQLRTQAPPAPTCSCPACDCPLTIPQLQHISPSAFRVYELACTDHWLASNDIITCPRQGCGVKIQRASAAAPQTSNPASMLGLSPAALAQQRLAAAHHLAHRFRCGACACSFCDSCRSSPYHAGYTCEQATKPDCLYCGDKVFLPAWSASASGSPGNGSSGGILGVGDAISSLKPSQLRSLASSLGVDISWCLEKWELLRLVQHFGGEVCGSAACKQKVLSACCKRLACGHWCCGVRGESQCMPCMLCPAAAGIQGATEVSPRDTPVQTHDRQQQQQPLQQHQQQQTHQQQSPADQEQHRRVQEHQQWQQQQQQERQQQQQEQQQQRERQQGHNSEYRAGPTTSPYQSTRSSAAAAAAASGQHPGSPTLHGRHMHGPQQQRTTSTTAASPRHDGSNGDHAGGDNPGGPRAPFGAAATAGGPHGSQPYSVSYQQQQGSDGTTHTSRYSTRSGDLNGDINTHTSRTYEHSSHTQTQADGAPGTATFSHSHSRDSQAPAPPMPSSYFEYRDVNNASGSGRYGSGQAQGPAGSSAYSYSHSQTEGRSGSTAHGFRQTTGPSGSTAYSFGQESTHTGAATPSTSAASLLLDNCPDCLEPLTTAPCVKLSCAAGHVMHLACAQARLRAGFPGPDISFTFLFCALCGAGDSQCSNMQIASAPVHLDHSALEALLTPHLALRAATASLAKQRLHHQGDAARAPQLQPGGRFDGRPADFALSRYSYYHCYSCRKPYFGGMKACGAGPPAAAGGGAAAAYDPKELRCGSCIAAATRSSAGTCPQHGTSYVEWKCRFCCDVASFFCWGTTHMCTNCHDKDMSLKACKPASCPLRAPHPQPGTEHCLGCGLCRTL